MVLWRHYRPRSTHFPAVVAWYLALSVGLMVIAPANGTAYEPHAPIKIIGDSGFTVKNGVVGGSGSVGDPFIISGWIIDASSANGIDISHTTAIFAIKEVYVHSESPTHYGISLAYNAQGKVENSTVTGNLYGIAVESSNDTSIVNSTFSHNSQYGIISAANNTMISGNTLFGNDVGISIAWSGTQRISNNVVKDNRVGIVLGSSTRATVTDNTIQGNSEGIYVAYTGGTIADNDITSNREGIHLYSARDVIVRGNVVRGNTYGIHFDFQSAQVTILGNDISEDYIGIYFNQRSCCATITYNTFESDQGSGIFLNELIWYVTVSYNRFLYGGIGLEAITSSNHNTVMGNVFAYNSVGVKLWQQSIMNLVYNNTFIANSKQAHDDSQSQNSWNFTYPTGGNYWSDYAGADNCSGQNQDMCPSPDGIGDVPYTITAPNRDDYPLARPHDLESPSWPYGSSLRVRDVGSTEVTLDWPPATDDMLVVAYRVYESDRVLATADGDTLSYTVANLKPNTTYRFRVNAVDVVSNLSKDTLSVNITTLPEPSQKPPGSPLTDFPRDYRVLLVAIIAASVISATALLAARYKRKKTLGLSI